MDLRKLPAKTPVESGFPVSAISLDLTTRCVLGCSYCNPAGTPILMADLTYKPIEDVKVGDQVVGFDFPSKKKAGTVFIISTVEAKMERESDLIEVTTDRSSFKCTPDHRWFSGRNYVPARIGGKIKWISNPVEYRETPDFMMGYIHGMMKGDGCISEGIHVIKNGRRQGEEINYYHARLALNDSEPLDRIEDYLIQLGWPQMNRFQFTEKMESLRTSNVELVQLLKGRPTEDSSDDYVAGWLGGIFDAEGSCKNEALRIHQKIGDTYQDIIYCIERLKFPYTIDETKLDKSGVMSVRVVGGVEQRIRFFALTRPCIMRKQEGLLIGRSQKGTATVQDIRPAGFGKVYAMQTSSGNYVAHGYLSKNCFAGCSAEYEGRDLDLETAEKVVGWLLDPGTRGENKKIDISFWGGEPLMKWELLQQIVLMAEERGKAADVVFTFNMTTNGVLMTPEKFSFFDEHELSFLLSLDGAQETHDRFRRFKNGKGSWSVIDQNATEILKWRPQQSVRMSLSENCLDNMMSDLDYLYNKGFNDIVYSVVHEGNWTEARMQKLSEIWRKISDWYIIKRRAGRPLHLKFLDDGIKTCVYKETNKNAPCGAGRGYLGITVDGSIWPCHRFNKMEDARPWYEKEKCLGHIETGIHNLELRERFVGWNPERDMENRCKECPSYLKNCTGHCWAANDDNCGDIALVPAIGCHINRQTLVEAQYVVDELKIEEASAPEPAGCICDNVYDRVTGTMHINRGSKESCTCNRARYGQDLVRPDPLQEWITLDGVARFLDSAIELADTRAEYLYQRLEELSEKTETNSAMEALDGKG